MGTVRQAALLVLLVIPVYSQGNFARCLPNRPDCCDRHRFCVFWAQRNECNLNPNWMARNCQVSCGVCRGAARTTSAAPFSAHPRVPDKLPPRDPKAPPGCNSITAVEVETRQVFSVASMNSRFRQIGCAEVQVPSDCSVNHCFHQRFRSIDGTCNNQRNTVMGSAFTPFVRLLPAAYDDGIGSLVCRSAADGPLFFPASSTKSRPNPREVSRFLVSSSRVVETSASSMLMQFAQFISHDVTKNAMLTTCDSCSRGGERCAHIPVSPNDPRRIQCITFTRSFPICGTGVGSRVRDQLNENTAFIDGSLIYSSEAVTLRSLRTGAMLKSVVVNNKVFPPNNGRDSMTVGDDRASIFVGLAALHTSFLRLHNTLAAKLVNMNPHWPQDRVFQEVRKIVGGIIQNIVYKEFLPTLLGPFHDRLIPQYQRYNPEVNPGMLNEFATSAYRLHGMIQEDYPLINDNFREVGRMPFINGVQNIQQALGSIDAIYRGFIATPARSPQRITTSVTEKIFSGTGDMAAINIQRGRDHGLRSYNEYRAACKLQTVTFDNWPEVSDPKVRARVRELYRQGPDQIDFYVGGIIEEPPEGGMVGPTFACVLAEQFVRLRDGDRFYYENPDVFTSEQLAALKKVTLSAVLCETGDRMTRISPRAFHLDQDGSNAIPCTSIQGLNLNPWRDD